MSFGRPERNEIARFRELPLDESLQVERGHKDAATLIDLLFAQYHMGDDSPEEVIRTHWPRIVGPNFAARCTPEKVDAQRRLVIRVPSAVVRRELSFHEDRMMTVIRGLPGCEEISGVILRAG